LKLKIQFDPEICFDQPVRRMNQIPLQRSPSIWIKLRGAAMDGSKKPAKPGFTGVIFPKDFSL
jgi:hypothetical protein